MAGSSTDDDDTGRESRSKMLKRHKAEVLKAQKEGQRMGKKRTEEAAALLAQVTARHIAELAAFDAAGAEATQQASEPAAAVAAVAAALAATSLPFEPTEAADAAGAAGKVCAAPSLLLLRALWCKACICELAEPPLPELTGCVAYVLPSRSRRRHRSAGSRSQKRRRVLVAQRLLLHCQALTVPLPQAEREARIAKENSNMGPSSRVVEEAGLIEKLSVRVGSWRERIARELTTA